MLALAWSALTRHSAATARAMCDAKGSPWARVGSVLGQLQRQSRPCIELLHAACGAHDASAWRGPRSLRMCEFIFNFLLVRCVGEGRSGGI